MRKEKEPIFDMENVASFTECTGLMPALPKDEQQDESYAELYGVLPAKKKK